MPLRAMCTTFLSGYPAGSVAGDTSCKPINWVRSRATKALRLLVDLKNAAVHGLDAAAVREFSDDDLLAAISRSAPGMSG